ncbi:MAG: hypothetical protein ACRD0K_21695 [Egibacteraceae bacterium]
MLIATSMSALAVVWIQQRAIVRLERRGADLADAVLGLPDSAAPADIMTRPGRGGPPTLHSPGGGPTADALTPGLPKPAGGPARLPLLARNQDRPAQGLCNTHYRAMRRGKPA